MTGAKVLIVDDEKAIRDGLHKVLVGEGYETELSHNGYSAVEKLQTIIAEHQDPYSQRY